MLYGNIIFIKKTGGDGSKFPVTEKDIKIGRSEDCLIRIHNSQIALQHCQLIIKDNGQTTLRDLSNQTILNGKPLNQEDVPLCHGDIFKLGERLARWEYLPTSKYYKQLLSPTGRLVAVVIPQQRSLRDSPTPGTSASQVSVLKNTQLGKRRFSERSTSGSSAVKMRKSSGTDLLHKAKDDLPKFLTSRHIVTSKLLLPGAKVKDRKSTSGVINSKTLGGKFGAKCRRSTLPSWKVNVVSPPERKCSVNKNSTVKSNKKSPKNLVKTLLKDVQESDSQKPLQLVSENGLKTPRKVGTVYKSEDYVKSTSKRISKTPSKVIGESSSMEGKGSVWSTRSKSASPEKSLPEVSSIVVLFTPKEKTLKSARLVHSETELNFCSERPAVFDKSTKKLSLILERLVPEEKKQLKVSQNLDGVLKTAVKANVIEEVSSVDRIRSRKSELKTPCKLGKAPRKSLLKENVKNFAEIGTPRKNLVDKTPRSSTQRGRSPRKSTSREVFSDVVQTPPLIDLNYTPTSKKYSRKSSRSTPAKKTPGKLVKGARVSKSSTSKAIRQSETTSPSTSSGVGSSIENQVQTSSIKRSSSKESSVRNAANLSKSAASSPRGVRRKLSPSSSAERAAKMLKTSSPKKPDKNKKAALLVLGKASRKQLLSQNVKVLLKQKIVKKAIKQSTAMVSQKEFNNKTSKFKEGSRKKTLKAKKKPPKNNKSPEKRSYSKISRVSDALAKTPLKSKTQEGTSKSKAILEESQISASKVQASLDSLKCQPLEKSPLKHDEKMESPRSITSSRTSIKETVSSGSFDKAAENYLFCSNRRSKRLSSKSDTGRPDFIELSPSALGLIPKHVDTFKTPKEKKRRSSSAVTPKNSRAIGIIKSASTSKIGNRKGVRFLSKDFSYKSGFNTPNPTESSDFDLSSIHTPDVTLDMFVSPLTDKSSAKKDDLNNSSVIIATEEISNTSTNVRKSCSEPKRNVRKLLQSPSDGRRVEVTSSGKSLPRSFKASTAESSPSAKLSKVRNSTKNDFKGVRQLFATPKIQKSPKNRLSDLKGVSKLLRTPRDVKSPKNEYTDLKGIKKLLATPKEQKSPKNDLTDVKGVKKLLATPKVQKSPRNDLTDVKGVKKLLATPKVQKSPRNDLTDVRGVKKLLATPKVQKSPRNDLTDVRGVKKLLATPKEQKSPKNDLTDVRGVKKLLATPKVQKSPKNDLTDVRGVKKLLATPKVQKSPRNDLTDVDGVKQLFGSPRVQKSPKNNLMEISMIRSIFESPIPQEVLRKSLEYATSLSSKGSPDVGRTKQFLLLKTVEGLKTPKTISRKPRVNDFKAIRGRRTIHSTAKSPKNDLSDVAGLRELFLRHKPASDYELDLSGVAELFNLPEVEVERPKRERKSMFQATPRTLRSRRESVIVVEKTSTLRGRLKKVAEEDTEKPKSTKKEAAVDLKEKKPTKRKTADKIKKSPVKKTPKKSKKDTITNEKKPRGKAKAESSDDAGKEIRSSRKRKVTTEEAEASPPKTRRKMAATEKSTTRSAAETSQKVKSRSKKEVSPKSEGKPSPRKTRSAKAEGTSTNAQSKAVGRRNAKGAPGRSKSPAAKRTARQKKIT